MFHNVQKAPVMSVLAQTVVIIASGLCSTALHAAVDQPTLSATVIEGSSAYSPTELFAVYRDQLGRPISRENAREILAQIEAMYLRDGYSRPEFRLDDDLTGNGILRIEVFEPQITQITFNGDYGPYATELDAFAADLRGRVPLRAADLQGVLQSMRELPGLTVRASTRRDETRRNGYTLTIDSEFKPIDGVIQISNRGTREIGPNFAFGQVVANSPFGRRERLGVLFSSAVDVDEYRGGGVFADVPITADGTHLATTLFKTESDPTEQPDRDDVYGRERMSLRATTPIVSTAAMKLSWSAGLDFDDLEILRDDERLRSERLRVFELGSRLVGRVGSSSQYVVGLQVRRGLNGMGSALNARDLAHDPRRRDFVLTKLQFTDLWRFAPRWTVRLDAFGQHSAYVLPDSERYKIGGERLGRGFEQTEVAGDQGLGGKLELRRDLSDASAMIGKTSLYGFYDYAAAWKQDLPGRESAASAGFGLALEYWRLTGFIEVAKPVTHADVEGDRDAKVFAEVKLKL
jgi:hemolysin activation/secretion protein